MKTLLFLVLTWLVLTTTTQAQGVMRELGVRAMNINQIDLVYKKAKSDHKYLRYRMAYGGFEYQSALPMAMARGQLGLAIGLEKRRDIANRLQWVHGWEPAAHLGYFYDAQRGVGVFTALAGIGYIVGFQYNFSPSFYVSAEVIPSIMANATLAGGNGSNTFGVRADFRSNLAGITAAYRFVPYKP